MTGEDVADAGSNRRVAVRGRAARRRGYVAGTRLARDLDMNRGLYTATSGGIAALARLDAVAQNLANVGTSGYKAERLVFRVRPLTESVPRAGDPIVDQTAAQVAQVATVRDFSQGPVRLSGNPLDVAIRGEGFFAVATPRGERYTRQGSFAVDAEGHLTTQRGERVQGENGDLRVGQGAIEIGEDGTVTVDDIPAGRLKVVSFGPTPALVAEGGAVFAAGAGHGRDAAGCERRRPAAGGARGCERGCGGRARRAGDRVANVRVVHADAPAPRRGDGSEHQRRWEDGMIRALYTAATGMQAQQLNIDVIANNLANVNTTGFKKSRADFQDLLYQTLRAPGAPTTTSTQSPTGIQVGLGTKPAAVQRLHAPGRLHADRQPARHRRRGRRLLPGDAARRHDRLHARRLVQARQPGARRHLGRAPARAADHHPGRRRRRSRSARTAW